MRTILVAFLATLAASLAATPGRLDAPKNSTPEEISRLDECIQRRFLAGDTFGMRRILPMQYHGVTLFQPENETERAVVDQLRRKGYEVALYLAGRNILTAQDNPPQLLNLRRSRIQGPAVITPAQPSDFPPPDTLLADGRSALMAVQKGEGYDIRKTGWTVTVRPLRASNQRCVQCHMAGPGGAEGGTKIGDPLGVAMYVYRRPPGH